MCWFLVIHFYLYFYGLEKTASWGRGVHGVPTCLDRISGRAGGVVRGIGIAGASTYMYLTVLRMKRKHDAGDRNLLGYV